MTLEQAKKKSWCIDNNITIYPIVWKEAKQYKPPRLAIQVNYQGFKRTGDMLWLQKTPEQQDLMAQKITELYEYYYNRDNGLT